MGVELIHKLTATREFQGRCSGFLTWDKDHSSFFSLLSKSYVQLKMMWFTDLTEINEHITRNHVTWARASWFLVQSMNLPMASQVGFSRIIKDSLARSSLGNSLGNNSLWMEGNKADMGKGKVAFWFSVMNVVGDWTSSFLFLGEWRQSYWA